MEFRDLAGQPPPPGQAGQSPLRVIPRPGALRPPDGSRWHSYGKFGAAAVDSTGGMLHAHDKHLSPTYDGKRVEFGVGASYRITT
ncbi:hypothetical protein OH491_19060 [Termitidicoccus mucosus]|uniref:hypothetical protein n=1 Tax=Termitidicoccus mucosus TaxID=1184151 RepID=UPI0011AB6B2A